MTTQTSHTALSSARGRWTMVAVILGSGIVFLDATVVNVALPKIGSELPSSLFRVLEAQTYVYTGYLLTLSALLILAGALNDVYGRRKMFSLGLVMFGVTSLLCGVAPTMELLILFRLMQGASGALLVPGSLSIITATFSAEDQGRAFGLWAGASSFTTVLGPFIGGILVDSISWRAAFLMNLPLVAIGLYATAAHLRESKGEQRTGHLDWFGASVMAVAIGSLSFGAIRGQEQNWKGLWPFVFLAVGAAATAAFPVLMARTKDPLVPLHLFKSRNFTVTNISTLIIYGSLYVTSYFVPIYIQGVLGYTAAAAGLSFLPSSLLLGFFSAKVGRWGSRYGPRLFMTVGPALMGFGLLLLLFVPASSAPWELRLSDLETLIPPRDFMVHFFPGIILFGIGLTLMVAPLTRALMTSVPVRHSGIASAINNAISRVGPQLAGAAIFVAISSSFYSGLAERVPNLDTSDAELRAKVPPLNEPAEGLARNIVSAARLESTEAFHVAMAVSAGLLFAGAVVNMWIRDQEALPD